VQMGTPLPILFKVVSHTLGQKNVSGVPAIHHSLGQVDSRSRDIGAIIHIGGPLTGPLWIPMRTCNSGGSAAHY
jgi:hypothetical protein